MAIFPGVRAVVLEGDLNTFDWDRLRFTIDALGADHRSARSRQGVRHRNLGNHVVSGFSTFFERASPDLWASCRLATVTSSFA